MNYVVGFVFDSDEEKVLLIEKQKPEWQMDFLNGIGGKVEEGESPVQAMVREFDEETGVETQEDDWVHFACGSQEVDSDNLYISKATVDFFRLTSNKVFLEARTMEEEEIRRVWVDLVHCSPVVAHLKWLVPLALTKTPLHSCVNFEL